MSKRIRRQAKVQQHQYVGLDAHSGHIRPVIPI